MRGRLAACPLAAVLALAVAGVERVAGQTAAEKKPPKIVVVKPACLIDGQGGPPIAGAVVVIEDDRIARVGTRLPVPAGAEVVGPGGATLLPGLIDCHTHVTGQPGDNYYEDIVRRSPIDYAAVAPVYARRTLEAGFTTTRDPGADELGRVSFVMKGGVVYQR